MGEQSLRYCAWTVSEVRICRRGETGKHEGADAEASSDQEDD